MAAVLQKNVVCKIFTTSQTFCSLWKSSKQGNPWRRMNFQQNHWWFFYFTEKIFKILKKRVLFETRMRTISPKLFTRTWRNDFFLLKPNLRTQWPYVFWEEWIFFSSQRTFFFVWKRNKLLFVSFSFSKNIDRKRKISDVWLEKNHCFFWCFWRSAGF